jgi:hypothetical protein
MVRPLRRIWSHRLTPSLARTPVGEKSLRKSSLFAERQPNVQAALDGADSIVQRFLFKKEWLT